MGAAQISYEESRKRRLEENKKRMDELNISKLSHALLPVLTPKHSSPVKLSKARMYLQLAKFAELRRSSRVAERPPPNYKDFAIEIDERPLKQRSYRIPKRKDLLNRVYASDEERANATEKAEKLHSELEGNYPSFVKPMLQSHVTGGFWLGLPNSFCKSYLPKEDTDMTLEDEDANESQTKYLGKKSGLSAGWRGFAIDHQLVDGDALVFQLITPTKFKVYIIRVYGNEDGGGDDVATDSPPPNVKKPAKVTRSTHSPK